MVNYGDEQNPIHITRRSLLWSGGVIVGAILALGLVAAAVLLWAAWARQ